MIQSRRHWVFDLDGTLVDSFPFYLSIVRSILLRFGKSLDDEETSECLGQPAAKFFTAKLGNDLTAQALDELRVQSILDAERIQPFTGILRLLEKLKAQKKMVAVWTSRDRNSANLVLKNTGIAPFVDFVVSGCCVSKHKPDSEGLDRIAKHFGCNASDLVVVGDHEFDVRAARTSGAYGIRACWHGFDKPESCNFAHELALDVFTVDRHIS